MGSKQKKSWADSDSDDEYPMLFKTEEYINKNGKNTKNENEEKKKPDISVSTGDDISPIRSKNAKANPIDIHSKTG
jgi:hypothetical protein